MYIILFIYSFLVSKFGNVESREYPTINYLVVIKLNLFENLLLIKIISNKYFGSFS